MLCRVGRIEGLATLAGLVIVISGTLPGRAADAALPNVADTAATVASAIERLRGGLGKSIASRPGRALHTARDRPAASWSGRQFVLMIGVAY